MNLKPKHPATRGLLRAALPAGLAALLLLGPACLQAARHAADADSASQASSPSSYGACVIDVVNSIISGLSGSGIQSLAVAQFREKDSRERSVFCLRLEKDLSDAIRTDTSFKVAKSSRVYTELQGMQGDSTDLDKPATLERFGQDLNADALLTGTYASQGSQVLLHVRLLRCYDGKLLWEGRESFPASYLGPNELNPIAGTQPQGYVQVVGPPTPTPPPAPVKMPPVLRPVPDFSCVSLELGERRFFPRNSTFENVIGVVNGAYLEAGWAGILDAQIDYWYVHSVNLSNINSLYGVGITLEATYPLRLGRWLVAYGGLGTRLESINVVDNNLPSQYGVSFGNDSFLGTLGLKVHQGPWGLDLHYSNDFFASDNANNMVSLGAYYDFIFGGGGGGTAQPAGRADGDSDGGGEPADLEGRSLPGSLGGF